ncbi:MAG TPA: hypothetical protein VM144_01090 [Aestuariivirga sp.]|nr:hypothetical protein [Aestuariivirga sp.]
MRQYSTFGGTGRALMVETDSPATLHYLFELDDGLIAGLAVS